MDLHEHVERVRVHLAIKATLAAVICGGIGIFYHLSYGYLSPLVTILILILFRGQTIKAGVPGLLGCLVAGSVALLISIVLNNAPWAYVICMLTWLFLWMAFVTPLPLGHLLGGILIAMIMFTVVLDTGRPEHLVLSFWTQVLIAIVVAAAVDRVLWPSATDDSLYDTLAALFESFAANLEALATASRTQRASESESMAELHHIAHLSSFFARSVNRNSRAEFEANLRCRLIWDRLSAIRRYLRSDEYASLQDEFGDQLSAVATELAGQYRRLAAAVLERRRVPLPGDDVRRRIEESLRRVREASNREPSATERALAAATLERFLRVGLADYDRLATAYNGMIDARTTAEAERVRSGSFMPDLLRWPTPAATKTSARLIVIVLVLLVGVLYLDFPGSSLVAFYGITFGLTANLGQLYMRGKSGILGVVGGLAYGVVGVMIVVQAPHLAVLMGIFALGVFVAAYLSTGNEPVAFAGLQAALITPYVFLIFEGPEWTFQNAVTRVGALAISAAVAVVIQRLLWPVDPLVLFQATISMALQDTARAWERLWTSAPRLDPVTGRTAGKEPMDALILEFGESAELLTDSRYLIGSDHPVAHAYLRILGSLEEILAAMRLLARLLRISEDNPLRDDAISKLGKEIDTVAKGLALISDYVGDRADRAHLIDLQARLAAIRDDHVRPAAFAESDSVASLEDQRQLSLLVETTGEITASLRSLVDAAVDVPDVPRRRRNDVPRRRRAAVT